MVRGSIALRAWLDGKGRGATTALAKRLGVSSASVIAWAGGKTRPEEHRWLAMESATGIVPSAWLEADDPADYQKRHGGEAA